MKKQMLALLALLVIPLAQAESVVIATNVSYADILVGGVVANKIGAEIFYTAPTKIPEEILSAMEEANPETIYIIGGPAVVSKELEEELSKKFDVVRVWGMTRYGTACEAAKYFWQEGSERAVIVWDKPDSPKVEEQLSELVAKARDLAVAENIPLLLIPKNVVPAEAEETLSELGVKEVYLVGDVGENVINTLETLNITILEQIRGELKEVEEKVQQKILEVQKEAPLVIVAVAEWQDIIAVPFIPRAGITWLVRSEEEIAGMVEKVKVLVDQGNISEIKVVGIPWLASKICDALDANNINHDCITGKRAAMAVKLMKKFKERIKEMRELHKKRLKLIKQKLEERAERIKEQCERFYAIANSTIESIEDETIKARLALVETLRKDCLEAIENKEFTEAWKIRNELKHHARLLTWEYRNKLKDDMEDEMEMEIKPIDVVKKRIAARKLAIETIKQKEWVKKLPTLCKEHLRLAEKLMNEGKIIAAKEQLRIAKRVCEKTLKQKIQKLPKHKIERAKEELREHLRKPKVGREVKETAETTVEGETQHTEEESIEMPHTEP
jgi:NifU-like protein involved in Fe-S cluster formation/methylmalonyl-CoA mutase cobalamin-binding subunit